MIFLSTRPYILSLALQYKENIIFQSVKRIFPASLRLTTYLLRTQVVTTYLLRTQVVNRSEAGKIKEFYF